ncbi:MAG: hypothetical protein PHC93_05195, partial [Candidatus Omnitrophica bacterium]|nr:hypothetical protein [Candidatus Omnitrophota bacterium]
KIIIPLLSPRGRTSVLYSRGQKGWKFGTFKIGQETTAAASEREKSDTANSEAISYGRGESGDAVMKKAEFDPSIKSKVLVVTDTYSVLDRIRTEILPKVDIKPKQVLIETKILEVKQDKLKDLGIDWGLGTDGATTLNPVTVPVSGGTIAGRSLTGGAGTSKFTPNAFNPLEGATAFPGTYPYVAGGQFVFNKMTGTKFQAVLHALEEDANTNILSAPRILTLDNQEASILVGYHTPILTSTVNAGTETTGPIQTQTLFYYQEIGIRLNVVPQISEEGHINMIVHPSVTSSSSSVEARNVAGTGAGAITTTTNYPIIDVREAQTQVLIHDNETIVIGGLLKDVKTKETIGIPLISKLPWVGRFFRRDIDNISKIDLLIFITARIIKEGDLSKEEIAKLEQGAGYVPPEALNFGDDKKKSWWQRIK